MTSPRVVIITGLSGSGLSTAIHTLQDSGFYCIDNLPIELLWDTIGLIDSGDIKVHAGYAFGMDIRNEHFAAKFPKIKKELSHRVDLDVVFIRADHKVLEDRFTTARRRHPLAHLLTSLKEQISREDELLTPVEMAADTVIDTSFLKPRQLGQALEARIARDGQSLRQLQVVLISFGFKHQGITGVEATHDIRFLPNPFFEPQLKSKSGLDQDVQGYVLKSPDAQAFLKMLMDLYRFSLPKYLAEGRHFIRIAVGCTGGRHRSVTFVEQMARDLRENPVPGVTVSVVHRDILHKDSER
jgi:UPF0042 nucleotide-binding protein